MFDHRGQNGTTGRLEFANDEIGINDNRATASKFRRDR
jgi:hypothetical protein